MKNLVSQHDWIVKCCQQGKIIIYFRISVSCFCELSNRLFRKFHRRQNQLTPAILPPTSKLCENPSWTLALSEQGSISDKYSQVIFQNILWICWLFLFLQSVPTACKPSHHHQMHFSATPRMKFSPQHSLCQMPFAVLKTIYTQRYSYHNRFSLPLQS